jgi:hypothetical protein
MQMIVELGKIEHPARIRGIGQVKPLPTRATFAVVDGEQRLLVPPGNAIATDAIGFGLGTLLAIFGPHPVIQIAGGLGASWMLFALMNKTIPFMVSEERFEFRSQVPKVAGNRV